MTSLIEPEIVGSGIRWKLVLPKFDSGWAKGEDGGVMETQWMSLGTCRNLAPETFFPSDGVGVDAARKIWRALPSKVACLEYAMENHIDHGVWVAPQSANVDE